MFTHCCGMTFPDWWRTLWANRFAVAWRFRCRAMRVTARSILNSWCRRREKATFGAQVDQVEVPPPLFIIGHWRSGTTLLHNLLACDPQFAFPTLYEVLFPHSFLLTEDDRKGLAGLLVPSVPRTRGIDDIPMGLDLPNEDEFATATASLCSPYFMWAFPRNEERYERYLTFRGASGQEVERWKAVFMRFLKKLTLRHGRPLVLKSPPHTGRIRLLLDLFPGARFVHVHRHPYVVFQSTGRLNDAMTAAGQFQNATPADRDEGIIRRYRAMHDAYFAERGLIPSGNLHELAFDDLERDPIGKVRAVYDAMGLAGYDAVLSRLENHVAGLAGYRRHAYPELSLQVKRRLQAAWGRSFDAWGYPS